MCFNVVPGILTMSPKTRPHPPWVNDAKVAPTRVIAKNLKTEGSRAGGGKEEIAANSFNCNKKAKLLLLSPAGATAIIRKMANDRARLRSAGAPGHSATCTQSPTCGHRPPFYPQPVRPSESVAQFMGTTLSVVAWSLFDALPHYCLNGLPLQAFRLKRHLLPTSFPQNTRVFAEEQLI